MICANFLVSLVSFQILEHAPEQAGELAALFGAYPLLGTRTAGVVWAFVRV